MPEFDVVGIGLNDTDTLILVPHFPAYAGKVAFDEEMLGPGGQIAGSMASARLGLRVKYIGAIGDDERGLVTPRPFVGKRFPDGFPGNSFPETPPPGSPLRVMSASTWVRSACGGRPMKRSSRTR